MEIHQKLHNIQKLPLVQGVLVLQSFRAERLIARIISHAMVLISSPSFLAAITDRMVGWMYLYSDSVCLLLYPYDLL